jgi:acetyltransferase-like isoleucine patch superfamily enzyme
MDKSQIKILQNSFKEYLKTDEPFFEFSVGSDLKIRNSIPFKVIFPGIQLSYYYFRHFISRVAQFTDYSPIKIFLYRLIGFKIGKGVYISPDVVLDSQFPELLEIGDYAVLGWGAKLFVHDYNGIVYRIGRVKIGTGTVVGGFSFIRAGVSIDDNSLVKLGSLIFNNKNPNVVSQLRINENIENNVK